MNPADWTLRHILIGLAVVFGLSALGCATLLSDKEKEVSFESEPEGATILVDGEKQGQTPNTLKLAADKERTIEFKKEGYPTKEYELENEISVKWLVIDLVAGGVPLVVDFLTGAIYKFKETEVSVALNEGGDEVVIEGAERIDQAFGPVSHLKMGPYAPAVAR